MSTSTTRTNWTQAELISEACRRFGDDPIKWAFVCPNCGETASAADFRAAGVSPNLVGQECIGRYLGAVRGCNWTAYGSVPPGPWFVALPDEQVLPSFPLADAEQGGRDG